MNRFIFLLTICLLFLSACSSGSSDSGTGTDRQDGTERERDRERPTLTVASAWLPGTLNPVSDGYSLIQRGIAETLTRVTHDHSIEPWLASSVEHVDDATWEITLRENVRFWNGERLTTDHIVDSFERAWEEQPASQRFLPEGTTFEVIDESTLRLTLPEPDSSLPHNLAAPQLVIYTMDEDEAVMTGPYHPTHLRIDESLHLEAFDDYWGGAPPLAGLTIRRVADGNARALAVQAGDVDMITEAAPEATESIIGDVAFTSVDSTRTHYIVVNHATAPFDDPVVRQAVNLAIDRDELNTVALGSLGTPVTSLIPPNHGIPTPSPIESDVSQAGELLEEGGWELGDDGVRTRGDERLAFLLYTYPGRPELTPIAVSIQDQLRRIGIVVSVQEVDDINAEMENDTFQAAMYSVTMLPTGDAAYALNVIGHSSGINNYGGYTSTEFDQLLDRIRETIDPDERDALILEAQELMVEDTAAIFLVAAPRVVLYREDAVEEPMLHPSEMYFIGIDTPRGVSD